MKPEDYGRHQRKVHLDMHLPEDLEGMFANFDPVEYVRTLREAHVNSVTIFAHCHHGNCYYDTAVGHKHSQLQTDYLREVTEEAHRHGIAVMAYFSCCWNARGGQEHPEWTQRDAEGNPRPHPRYWWWMCLNSPYRDFLTAMVREVAEGYPVDGLWFDITYVHPQGCYCEHCQRLYRDQYGADMPVKPAPGTLQARRLYDFRVATETGFRSELVRLIKSINPELLVSWNHAGDVTQCYLDSDAEADILFRETHTPENWLPSFQARWFQHFGKTFEGCTSRFHYGGWSSFTYKHPEKLRIEAATALAHGGIIDIGDQSMPDGTLDNHAYELIGSVYEQAEELEKHCRDTESVPNLAILHSSRAHHLSQWFLDHPSRRSLTSVFGAARILSEGHLHFDIISERALDRLGDYHAVIIPDQLVLTEDESAALRAYVEGGGGLMASYRCGMRDEDGGELAPTFLREVCGVEPLRFAEYSCGYVTDLEFEAPLPDAPVLFRSPGEAGSPLAIPALECQPLSAEPIASLTHPVYERTPQHYFAANNAPPGPPSGYGSIFRNRLGEGTVIYFPFALFKFYWLDSYYLLRDLTLPLVHSVAPHQELYADAPSHVEVVLRRRGQTRFVHLINYANQRFGAGFHPVCTDEVVPVNDIPLSVGGEAHSVTELTEGRQLDFDCRDGYTHFILPQLYVHAIVAIDLA